MTGAVLPKLSLLFGLVGQLQELLVDLVEKE